MLTVKQKNKTYYDTVPTFWLIGHITGSLARQSTCIHLKVTYYRHKSSMQLNPSLHWIHGSGGVVYCKLGMFGQNRKII